MSTVGEDAGTTTTQHLPGSLQAAGTGGTLVVTVQQQWGAASYDTPIPTPHTAGP